MKKIIVPRKRKVEPKGRVLIPADMRDKFNIKPLDEVSLYITDEGILIKKEN